jgi:endoglucanase
MERVSPIKIILLKGIFVLFISFILELTYIQQLGAQVSGPQTIKWMYVSPLRNWFSNGGAEIEYGRRGRNSYLSTDQIDGLNWPAPCTSQDVNIGKSLWIGTTNFSDPVRGITYPYKVVCAGRQNLYLNTEIIPEKLTLVGNAQHPVVTVDDASASDLAAYDSVDTIDPNLKSDRMIINIFHTSIGISVTRKILSFTQQYHDNYYIYEYTFKNTGIIDSSGQQKINQTLTGVVFQWQYRKSFAGESYHNGWAPTGASWGRNTINDVMGDPNHPGNVRAVWSYYGPMSTASSLANDIGLPKASDGSIMAGTNFSGVVVLHADKSPKDTSDDPSQPFTTKFMGCDQDAQNIDQYDSTLMMQKYGFMSAGHLVLTHAEQIGKDANGWPTAAANTWGTDPGGYAAAQGFGPYTLAPGDSIRIIVAEAVAGLMKDRDLVKTIANKWFTNSSPFILPNGSTTTDRNIYKNSWVFSGKDSLFQTFQRAIANYANAYRIPQPPPPPSELRVYSGSKKITLNWTASAETWPGFNGYKIYRAEGTPDATYSLLFSCDKNNIVHTYEDRTAVHGINYYYYIQTKDDGSTNTIEPGVPLVSGKLYTMTNTPAKNTSVGNDTTIVERYDQLHVDKTKIVDKNGNPVTLRGMSLYWSQWKGQFYNYDCIKWLRDDWKCSIVRAAMAVESGGYLTNPSVEMSKIKTVIEACIDLGIYVLVDWHDNNAQNHLTESIGFFEEIARQYGTTPNVIYEIFNEPLNTADWSTVVKPYADSVVKHIRAIDPVNLIIVGTPTWSQDVDVASRNPLTATNIAYAFHFYAHTHLFGSYSGKVQTALNNGIAIFVTEFGTTEASGTGVVDSNQTDIWLNYLNTNNISWCNWSVADLTETSAILAPGSSPTGGWPISVISPSGLYVRRKLQEANGSLITTVPSLQVVPTSYELFQNYPNPFNPTTTISYSLPEVARVKIEIYNILGKNVAVLIDQVENAGHHSVTWDAQKFASGIYYYRIKIEGTKPFEKTQKLVLIR